MMEIEIVKSKMANALTSADSNHVIAVADDVYDEDLGMYQSELNENVSKGYVYDVEKEEWVPNAIPVATDTTLGGVMTGDGTGIKVEEQIIKADFDTTDYSEVEDITTHQFPTNTVASPDVVNKIVEAKLNKAIYDVLNSEY